MVYFMQAVEGGPIKIGYSADVDRRRGQLEAHYGATLMVLATMDGGPAEETAIHRRFSRLRLGKTEQFRPARELMEFIGRPSLVGMNPDAAEAMSPKGAPAKIDSEAVRIAKIVAAYRDITLAEYLSEIIMERAARDLEQEQARSRTPKPPKPPKR
jgi:hypothetical protein